MLNPYAAPAKSEHRVASKSFKKLQLLAWFYPIGLVTSFYATWLVAWATLGYRPRPSLDDPSSIGLAVDLAYYATGALLIAFPVAAIGGLALQVFATNRGLFHRFAALSLLAALWIVSILVLRWDPLRVGDWYMD